MQEQMSNGYQIQSNTFVVWVNEMDGGCVARFGKNGIDIHLPTMEQMALGKQCLECSQGRTYKKDWDYFVSRMRELYGVEISNKHKPMGMS